MCRAAKKAGDHTVSIFTGRKKTAFSRMHSSMACHATTGPPKIGPPGPVAATILGPPGLLAALQLVPPRTTYAATVGPPLP